MTKLTATNSSSFPKLQSGGLLYLGNLFNGSANGNPQDIQICYDIPATPCGELTADSSCTISFKGEGDRTNSGGVLSFPHALLGSLGGRSDTWGVECGNFSLLPGTRDFGSNASGVYDLNVPAAAVGYPALVGNLPSTIITVDSFDCGDPGNYNSFVDSYWYDTTQNPPSGGAYSGTINGINSRCNRLWNLNIWPYNASAPASPTQWTGGQVIDTGVIIGGKSHTVVAKHEQGGGNNFFYVGIVCDVPTLSYTLDYNAYAAYMLSNQFWNAVQGSAHAQGIIAAMANPQNGQKPLTAIRPNASMWVDGIGNGNEVWGTVSPNTEAAICYNEQSFTVDGQVYGKVVEPEPDTLICLNPPLVSSPDTIPASSLVSGGVGPYFISNLSGTPGISTSANGSALVVNAGVSGLFPITYTITDGNGLSIPCSGTLNITTQNDGGGGSSGPNNLSCAGSEVIKAGVCEKLSASDFVTGGDGPFTISNFSTSGGGITNQNFCLFTGRTQGTYTLSFTVTDSFGFAVDCTRQVQVCRCVATGPRQLHPRAA